MAKPVVFLFSGQGSQYFQMAKELLKTSEVFAESMRSLDRVAAALIGESVMDNIYDGSKRLSDRFERTLFTHPAIYMVEVSLARMLQTSGVHPDAVIGFSLGEYAASAVAGAAEQDQLLELVVKQAQLLDAHCRKGRMMAVLHEKSLYHDTPEIRDNSRIISLTEGAHFTITGTEENIGRIEDLLKSRDVSYQMLPITHAFHSDLIDPAAEPFCAELRRTEFRRPSVPMVSSLQGQWIEELPADYLWQVVRESVLHFPKAVESIRKKFGDCLYIDLGPGGTLAAIVKQGLDASSQAAVFSVVTPFHQEVQNVEKIRQEHVKVNPNMTYVFPGQGSQQKGMGANLFDEFPELTAKADEILGYSIKELCLEDPNGQLGQTQFTQPALYTVNALSYLKKVKETGERPAYVAGHSLGEYDALFAAGAFEFETGLKLVKKRGELMSQARGGGMAAVIGLSEEQIEQVLKDNQLDGVQIANYNSPSQIVIAGVKEEIESAAPFFQAAGVKSYVPLKVSGAFHSFLMSDAQKEFEEFLNSFTFHELTIPVISNVHARPYKQGDVKRNLVKQITHPVKWTESVRYLMAFEGMQFEEVGPGNVLKGLVRTIMRQATPLPLAEIEAAMQEASAASAVAEEPKQAASTGGKKAKKQTADGVAAKAVEAASKAEAKAAEAAPKAETKAAEAAPKAEAKAAETAPKAVSKTADPVSKAASKTAKVVPKAESKQPNATGSQKITAASLGDAQFKADYGVRYAYVAGSMHHGISSEQMVVKMAKSGMLSFLGTSGLSLDRTRQALESIQRQLRGGEPYGLNVQYNINDPELDEQLFDLCIRYGVRTIEASGYLSITPALVKYRLKGLKREADGTVSIANRILAKASRPEVAEKFLSPAPEQIVAKLLESGQISQGDADLLRRVPMADDLCAVADSGGQTDQAVGYALLPTILKLREQLMAQHGYAKRVRIGAGGGIGTPEAAAAAFVMGADFILTGSINQCTVEAATSDAVKDLLQNINVQDTEYAPDQNMFEIGAKVQVLKKGLFFPARANKLFDLYRHYNSWHEIDEKTKTQLQTKYLKRTFDQAYAEVKATFPAHEIEKAERNPKHKMALVFRWYFVQASNLAMIGSQDHKVDYQVHCGPALGAFNQWVKGTELENWRNRSVDAIGETLMNETVSLLNNRLAVLFSQASTNQAEKDEMR